jgi:hypothetical protein
MGKRQGAQSAAPAGWLLLVARRPSLKLLEEDA